MIEFVKAHGTGNDFVLLPDLDDRVELTASLTAALCTPHTGLGADGVIRLAPSPAGGDVFMDYRNADGSIAEMCGNGVRCVAKYVADRGLVAGDVVRVDTRGGIKPVEIVRRDHAGRVTLVRVDMGAPIVEDTGDPVEIETGGGAVLFTRVSMGNPHAVAVARDVDAWPLHEIGAALQHHRAFPDGVNVEVITAVHTNRIRGRIFERGVGETLASGTGASAMAAAAITRGLAAPVLQVQLRGGTLDVDWSQRTLLVTGPAVEVASGTLDDTWLTTIRTPGAAAPPTGTPQKGTPLTGTPASS